MSILVFFLILFIFQVILLIFSIKEKQKIIWKELFVIEVMSIVGVILHGLIYTLLWVSNTWDRAIVYMLSLFALVIYVVLLMISIIIKNIMNKKILENQVQSKIIFLSVLFIIIFLIFTIIDVKPQVDEKNNRKAISDYVIDYLNDRYGNSNYKVEEIFLDTCFLKSCTNGYVIYIKSDNLNQNFKIEIDKITKKITEDNFIELYAEENHWYNSNETSFNEYLINVVEEELMSYVLNPNDYRVNLDIGFDKNYGSIDYGRIPTIDDLKEAANISFDSFTIYRNFDNNNEDEFKEFMVDVYKNYVKYYKKYNNSDSIDFYFKDGNPFYEDNLYGYWKNGGSIRDREGEDYIYIYKNGTPITVSKQEIGSE